MNQIQLLASLMNRREELKRFFSPESYASNLDSAIFGVESVMAATNQSNPIAASIDYAKQIGERNGTNADELGIAIAKQFALVAGLELAERS